MKNLDCSWEELSIDEKKDFMRKLPANRKTAVSLAKEEWEKRRGGGKKDEIVTK